MESGAGFQRVLGWTGGGDGKSLFEEANWTEVGGGRQIDKIEPKVDVPHDLLIERGFAGGGSSGARLASDLRRAASPIFNLRAEMLRGSNHSGRSAGNDRSTFCRRSRSVTCRGSRVPDRSCCSSGS